MEENLIVTWLSVRTYACPPLHVSPGEITHSSTREFWRLIYSQPLCSQHILLLVFLLGFFSLLLIFTLLAASMSHFLTSAWNLLCTSSPLFFISRSSSFSIIPRQCRKLVKKNTGYDILRIKLVNRKFYVVVVQQQRQRKKVHCACKVFFFLLNRPVNFCRARHHCRFSLEQITSTVYEDIS